MTNCPACGAPTEENAETCAQCGLRLEGATQSFAPVGVDEELSGPEPAEAEGPVLVVRKGPELGERFYVDRPRLTIGRDPAADIFLNDVTVSRSHAVLTVAGSEVTISDAGSLNGTYVNGLCVDKAPLRNGDGVQIGLFQMVFLAGRGE